MSFENELVNVWMGDVVTDPTLYPFLVSVDLVDNPPTPIGQHECGGTMLTPTWVLTAGHCVTIGDVNPIQNKDNMRVRYGVLDYTKESGTVVKVKRVLRHPLYTTVGGTDIEVPLYDAGLLELEEPIPIPTVTLSDLDPEVGSEPTVIGWGLFFPFEIGPSPQLRQGQGRILPQDEIKNATAEINGVPVYTEFFDPEVMIGMTSGIPPEFDGGSSPGDSGGPLLLPDENSPTGWKQVGVVSWGVFVGQANSPDIYTKITQSEVRDWINEVVFPSTVSGLQIAILVVSSILLVLFALTIMSGLYRKGLFYRDSTHSIEVSNQSIN